MHTITKCNNSYSVQVILNIKQSSSFSKKYVPKLKNFYDQYLAPELAYPRVALGIPQLGKVIENV